ncbi:thioredoxin family protein [Sulfurimonas sp. MAG313]|nr:thioredoxin family protein [Sulfurimonas sp. MAG313]MDF1879995.1 thioredoxin family protein [Sulfurimonas sp. MAG313]
MYKVLVLVIALCISLLAEPQWLTSYDEAKTQAKDQNKSILIMISKESCDACWYMENIVFEDNKVKKLIHDNFIPVYLDIANDIPEEFKYIGTPTFYFMDKNASKMGYQITGAKNVKEFSAKIQEILTQ